MMLQINNKLSCVFCPGYNHSTLVLNNNNRGPPGNTNVVTDYSSLEEDVGKAWFLPQHGQHTQAGKTVYWFFYLAQVMGVNDFAEY